MPPAHPGKPEEAEKDQAATATETLRSIQAELARLAEQLQGPGFAHSDGRFPTYVILTTRKGLRQKYGRHALI